MPTHLCSHAAQVMERRLLGRNEGRTDDNIETIRKRFHVRAGSSMAFCCWRPVLPKQAAY